MNKGERKNFLFLGFAIPDKEMDKLFTLDGLPQVQTHKFNWNLVKGLEYCDVFDITYISSRPITDYPVFPQKKIRKNKWNVDIGVKTIEIQEIPFINKGVLKLVTRFFAALYYGIKNFRLKPNKSGVIVYSVNVPYMIVGLIISKIYNVDCIAIWTDPPAVSTNKDSGLKLKLRNAELKLSKKLMKKFTKIIALTKFLAEDFAPNKPYIIIEGIINPNDINQSFEEAKEVNKEEFTRIIYTGSLDKRYGINNIIEALSYTKNKKIVFEIYGKGDFENELKSMIKKSKNIVYKGFVPNDEIIKIQRRADFLINARSNDDEFVKYSFPSKTLEYMLSGTPLITTMLPGIPKEYKNYVIVLENNNPEVIGKKVDEILKFNHNERKEIGLKALNFAKTKNYVEQAEKIIAFLNKPL